MLRRLGVPAVAVLVVVALVGGTAVAQGAAKQTSARAFHDAFVQLRQNLRFAHSLTAHERRSMLRTTRRAEAQRAHRRACASIKTLERLRKALHRTGARVGGVSAVEYSILGTARGAGCALRTRKVKIEREPIIVGGPIKPLKRVLTTPDENERAERERVLRSHGLDPGPPTTVIPASAPPASSSFGFSTLTDLGSPQALYIPEEPSQASAGNVVWYTHNSGAAFSLDGGKSFTQVDPRRMFPELGHAFCCDQVVVYAPQINRFIWYAQYWCPPRDERCDKPRSSNFVRLFVASPQDIRASRADPAAAWKSWLIRPRDIGARHQWLDYPDVGLGRHSLYVTSNMYGGDAWSVVARIPLAALKRGTGFAMRYRRDDSNGSYRVAPGTATRGFLATHSSPTTLRTLTWDDGSPLLFPHRSRHGVITNFDYTSDAGGVNWNFRTDDRIKGATRRGNELWFAWSEGRSICRARCDEQQPGLEQIWPQPHIHVVVVDARSFRLVRERFIHNPDFATAYPTLATDSRRRVGMTFSYGGGTAGNASPAAGYLTGGEEFRQVRSSPAPGYQGDYFSLRPDWPDRSRLTASGYVSESGSNGYAYPHWLFYRFSR